MRDSARMLVLHEEMNDKFNVIMEYVRDIPEIKQRVTRLEEDLGVVGLDVSVIKNVVKQHSKDIADLKGRL
jgi:type IV secretory pathway ATPase VirB11/archaellum biosynthesis ATPase